MITKYRHGLELLSFYVVLLIVGLFILKKFDPEISPVQYATILTLMTIVTFSAYLLLIFAMRKPAGDRGIYLIGAIGGKFLAYLIIILIYWIMGKNISKDFIIVFFILYLMLTFSLLRIMLKLLKTN